jgi:type II secretory pathway pseudopilin PulG
MKWATRGEQGDTLIEVLLGIAILSMIMVSSIVFMTKGQAIAFNALERSQVQALMSQQSAMLSYLRDAYSDAITSGQSPQAGTAAAVWETITTTYSTSPNTDICTPNTDPNQAPNSFYLTYNPAPATNPVTLASFSGGSATTGAVPGQGMWIEAQHVNGSQPYIDFFIKACWQPNGIGAAQEAKNVVRLYIPTVSPAGASPVCVPTDIAMVLDASGSMNNAWGTYPSRMARLKEVSVYFVNNAGVGPNVSVGIVQFSGTASLRQDLTTSIAALTNAINTMGTSNGTQYQPAMNIAQTILDNPRRRVMVFISDGEPSDTTTPAPGVVALATDMKVINNISIYTVGITAASNPNAAILLDSMDGNGGFYGDAANPSDLDNIINSIIADIGCTP